MTRRRSESYRDILARAKRAEVIGTAKAAREPSSAAAHAMYSHGAVFAEVKVDPTLGQVRVTRLVGAFAAAASSIHASCAASISAV